MIVLIDHNIEGQAALLWKTLVAEGWLDWITIQFVTFEDIELSINSSDRVVWRFAQKNEMLLLTANRKMSGEDSLEETIRDENTANSFPVLTIANADKVREREYRERCAARLIDIVIDLENAMGVGRIYIP
jgi:hypothetical protein